MDRLKPWIATVHARLEAERTAADEPSCLYPPAPSASIDELEVAFGCPLPASYRQFLEISNGWTGFWFGLVLTGADGVARERLEAELAEEMPAEAGRALLGWAAVLGANVDEDLYLVFDRDEALATPAGELPEPQMQIYSLGEGALETFGSFAHLLETLAEADPLPRTVPLDLEAQFRAWTEGELLQEEEEEEDEAAEDEDGAAGPRAG